jgi:hypothetical protein
MKKHYFILLILAGLSIQSCKQSGKYELAYRFTPGNTYEVYSETHTSINQETMGQKIETDNKQKIWIDWNVLDMDKDSVYSIEAVYRRLVSEINSADSSITLDSDQPDLDMAMVDNPYFMIVNKALDMKVNKRGRIIEMKGMTDMLEEMMGDELNSNPAMRMMIMKMTDEGMKSAFAQYQIFPDKAVEIGESWGNSFTMDMVVSFTSDNKYSLESVDGDKATIKLEGKLSSAKPKSNDLMGMIGSMMEIKGLVDGFFTISLQTGEIINAESITDMEATISMMGMKMPMIMKSTNSYRITKK